MIKWSNHWNGLIATEQGKLPSLKLVLFIRNLNDHRSLICVTFQFLLSSHSLKRKSITSRVNKQTKKFCLPACYVSCKINPAAVKSLQCAQYSSKRNDSDRAFSVCQHCLNNKLKNLHPFKNNPFKESKYNPFRWKIQSEKNKNIGVFFFLGMTVLQLS